MGLKTTAALCHLQNHSRHTDEGEFWDEFWIYNTNTYAKKANSNGNLLMWGFFNNYLCNFIMFYFQERKVKLAVLIFNAFQTKVAWLVTSLCVQGRCQLASTWRDSLLLCRYFWTEFLQLYNSKKEAWGFSSIVAIQIVIKPSQVNALESLILFPETELLIVK